MAELRVRAASLYIRGKKMGTCSGTTYTYNTGDELQYGDPGVVGFSDGAENTALRATHIHPVAGMGAQLMKAMQNKEDLDIALSLIDGAIHQVTMRCTQCETTSEHKNGTQQGVYQYVGGAPKIT